jgi:hypothetical protein
MWGRLLKKTRGRQSRATVPLTKPQAELVAVVATLYPKGRHIYSLQFYLIIFI